MDERMNSLMGGVGNAAQDLADMIKRLLDNTGDERGDRLLEDLANSLRPLFDPRGIFDCPYCNRHQTVTAFIHVGLDSATPLPSVTGFSEGAVSAITAASNLGCQPKGVVAVDITTDNHPERGDLTGCKVVAVACDTANGQPPYPCFIYFELTPAKSTDPFASGLEQALKLAGIKDILSHLVDNIAVFSGIGKATSQEATISIVHSAAPAQTVITFSTIKNASIKNGSVTISGNGKDVVATQ